MADDLFDDVTNLPKTIRGEMPYSVDALATREIYGHGHSSTSVLCKQKWALSPRWLQLMLGEVYVDSVETSVGVGLPLKLLPRLRRHVPERLRWPLVGDGTSDRRRQWATGSSEHDQGGNPASAYNQIFFAEGIEESTEPFRQIGTNWPATLWIRHNVQFETTPFRVLTDAEVAQAILIGGQGTSTPEMLRYVVRERKVYGKEQPLPGAAVAGGFRLLVDPDTVPTSRLPVGNVISKRILFADCSMTWVRIPVGWPPPIGFTPPDPAKPWPPASNPAGPPGFLQYARDTYVGTVNDNLFDANDLEGFCAQAGTLLYTGYEDRFYDDAVGDRVCDRTYRFKWNSITWNKFYDSLGRPFPVSSDGSLAGRKPYETSDFRDLFRTKPV